MTRYMPMVGKRGLDMMYRTATIQVNLDFADEADMVKKFRVSLALQPVATAIFACSPFTEGRPNGFLSMRSEVWRDTDKARTGMLPFVFEPGMSFERYVVGSSIQGLTLREANSVGAIERFLQTIADQMLTRAAQLGYEHRDIAALFQVLARTSDRAPDGG